LIVRSTSYVCDSTANGSDCLHAAVSHNLPKVVDILCQKGAQVDKCDCSGESALWLALSAEQSEIADVLVSYRAERHVLFLKISPFEIAVCAILVGNEIHRCEQLTDCYVNHLLYRVVEFFYYLASFSLLSTVCGNCCY
jgi:hypothetical protein